MLKNEDDLLPLKAKNISIFGKNAKNPITGGGGSGAVTGPWVSTPLDAINEKYLTSEKSSNKDCSGVSEGKDHSGDDLYNQYVSSKEACCDLCNNDANCASYVFESGLSHCYIKSSTGTTKDCGTCTYGEPSSRG